MMQEAGDLKILLKDLLTGSEITKENWNWQLITVNVYCPLHILSSTVEL